MFPVFTSLCLSYTVQFEAAVTHVTACFLPIHRTISVKSLRIRQLLWNGHAAPSESWNDYDVFCEISHRTCITFHNMSLPLCLSLSSRSLARPHPNQPLRSPPWSLHSTRYKNIPLQFPLTSSLPAALPEIIFFFCQLPTFSRLIVARLTSDLLIIWTMCSISFRCAASGYEYFQIKWR